MWNKTRRRAVTASDAAYESGRGSAGFLSVIDPKQPEETRLGRVISLPSSLYEIWGARVTYIAQLELLAVLVALTEVAGLIRGTNSIWLVDNIAADGTGERFKWLPLSGPDGQASVEVDMAAMDLAHRLQCQSGP